MSFMKEMKRLKCKRVMPMNSFNDDIDKGLLSKVACGDITATMELGEIFYQQRRYGFATSLFILASKYGNQKAAERLADIDRFIHSNQMNQKEQIKGDNE